MYRFVLQQNVERFQALLASQTDAGLRRTVGALLNSARRELAMLESAVGGARSFPYPGEAGHGVPAQVAGRRFQAAFETAADAFLLLDPGPGLRIVDANAAYAAATMTARGGVVGEKLFDIFPDNPDDAGADGVTNLFASLRIAVESKRPHAMHIQRYDIRDATGAFVERYWRPLNAPVFDETGKLRYLLHHVKDVTGAVRGASASAAFFDSMPDAAAAIAESLIADLLHPELC